MTPNPSLKRQPTASRGLPLGSNVGHLQLVDGEILGLAFELPEEAWTAQVRRLRLTYDPPRAKFPIEITVAGSSGLGCLSPGQTPDVIASRVRDIARVVAPIHSAFLRVDVFPQSRVYYLSLVDETPFHTFQRALVASSLKFEPVAFEFKPHCTIAALPKDASAAVRAELMAFPVPSRGVIISSLGLYAVNSSINACRLVSRVWLGA